METTKQIGNDINYCHDKQEDKYYFGSFFNLAQNNINQIFDEFCARIGESSKQSAVDVIKKYFSNKSSYSDWEKRIEILREYLPVIDYLNLPVTDRTFENYEISEKENKRREYFRTNMINLLKAINEFRNFYTHFYHSPVLIEENTFNFLDSIFLKVCVEVKQKRMKDDKTRQILKQRIKEEFEILKKLKKEELKEKERK